MRKPPLLQQRIELLSRKLLSASADIEAHVTYCALSGLLLAAAQAIPEDRALIRELMRGNVRLLDAMGDAVGDEAAAIVLAHTRAADPASGQEVH